MPKKSKPYLEHKKGAPTTLGYAVITISTSRYHQRRQGETKINDEGGDIIAGLIQKAKSHVVFRELVPDEREEIHSAIRRALSQKDVDVIVTTGGTGFTKTDVTIESIRDMLDKEMPGFGELFRKLSYDEIGSPAIMTRALGGVVGEKAVFCLPGSPRAVETGMKKLILPEAGHLIKLLRL